MFVISYKSPSSVIEVTIVTTGVKWWMKGNDVGEGDEAQVIVIYLR